MTEHLRFVDVESTGLDPRTHDVWEIAVICRVPGLGDDEYVFQIAPDLEVAEQEALEVSRFHERYFPPADPARDACRIEDGKPAEWLPARDVWWEVQDLLRGAHLVCAVPSFDTSMMAAMLHRLALKTTWHHRLICVESMAMPLLGWAVPRGLAKTAEALGVKVDPERAHTALGDARLARDVYDAVLAQAREGEAGRG